MEKSYLGWYEREKRFILWSSNQFWPNLLSPSIFIHPLQPHTLKTDRSCEVLWILSTKRVYSSAIHRLQMFAYISMGVQRYLCTLQHFQGDTTGMMGLHALCSQTVLRLQNTHQFSHTGQQKGMQQFMCIKGDQEHDHEHYLQDMCIKENQEHDHEHYLQDMCIICP